MPITIKPKAPSLHAPSPPGAKPTICVNQQFNGKDDQAFFITTESPGAKPLIALFRDRFGEDWRPGASLDAQVTLCDGSNRRDARLLVSTAETQNYWCLIARLSGNNQALQSACGSSIHKATPQLSKWTYTPNSEINHGPVPISLLSRSIADCILSGPGSRPSEGGLILISGSTSSGKSKLAEALTYEALRDFQYNRPLEGIALTVEAPLSSELYVPPDLPVFQVTDSNHKVKDLCIIRRQLSPMPSLRDAESLVQVLTNDARRQHPKVVLVDEVRNDQDWPEIIEFALTRHTIITTTHASNLPLTISRVLRGCKCIHPSDRARVARALMAVVHLAPCKCANDSKALVPSLWLRTKASIEGLEWPGEASVTPGAGGALRTAAAYCYGRTKFVKDWKEKLGNHYDPILAWAVKTDREGS